MYMQPQLSLIGLRSLILDSTGNSCNIRRQVFRHFERGPAYIICFGIYIVVDVALVLKNDYVAMLILRMIHEYEILLLQCVISSYC
jgi:hypothetical protein